MMTFEQFQQTGRDSSSMGGEDCIQDDMLAGAIGRIYLDALWMEDTYLWPKSAPGYGKGRWYTRIGNQEHQSNDLAEMERVLFQFAQSEGYLEP